MRKLSLVCLALLLLVSLSACRKKGTNYRPPADYYDDTCSSMYSTSCSGYSDPWDDDWDSGSDWDDDDSGGDWDDDDGGWDDDTSWDPGTYCDGSGFCYNNGNPSAGRDIVGQLADQETAKILKVSEAFGARYKLPAQTALSVARAFYDWGQVAKKRTRTQRDVEAFTKRLYNVDFSRVTLALEEANGGNLAPLNGAIEDAANHWGTTPETMKEILTDWYGGYTAPAPTAQQPPAIPAPVIQ